jgi:nucleoside-diphosphate-sugar epimerase
MKTILLTGCAGFIGSHLSELLLDKGFKVIGIDNFDDFYSKKIKEQNMSSFIEHQNFSFNKIDITSNLQNVITETNIDAVIHLAAKAGVRPSIEYPEQYINTNITGTRNIHALMLAKGIKKLVFASSSSVYGNQKKVPFSEDDNVDFPISPYAFTKKAGELMNFTLHHLSKIDIVNLRFFTVYGPRQRPDLAIHKFVKQISNDKPVTMFGDGSTARDYTYVDDTVKGIYNALNYCIENSNVYVTLNLGNEHPVKLKDLVSIIFAALNKTHNINYEGMQPGDVDITYADISKAKALINYKPEVEITEGIKRFVKWYNEQNKG